MNNILQGYDVVCEQWHPLPLNSEVTISTEGCTLEVELPGCVWVTLHDVQRRLLNVLIVAGIVHCMGAAENVCGVCVCVHVCV